MQNMFNRENNFLTNGAESTGYVYEKNLLLSYFHTRNLTQNKF